MKSPRQKKKKRISERIAQSTKKSPIVRTIRMTIPTGTVPPSVSHSAHKSLTSESHHTEQHQFRALQLQLHYLTTSSKILGRRFIYLLAAIKSFFKAEIYKGTQQWQNWFISSSYVCNYLAAFLMHSTIW